MKRLKERIGKEVEVLYVLYGREFTAQGVLKDLDELSRIEIDGASIPFIGYGCAIIEVKTDKGEVIYENRSIREYDAREPEGIAEAMREKFGRETAASYLNGVKKANEDWEEKKKKLNSNAEKKKPYLIKEGLELIKDKKKQEEWKRLVSSSNGFYSIGIIEGAVNGMKKLSEGASLSQAEEAAENGQSVNSMSYCCSLISYYSRRGEEFRRYWNRQFGEENSEGVVNPAVLHISKK